jgi:hypothetical protein
LNRSFIAPTFGPNWASGRGVSIGPGLTMLARMLWPANSAVRVRTNERRAAFVALYVEYIGIPFLPGAGAVDDDRNSVLHQREGLPHGKESAPGIYAEGLVLVLGRNVGSRYGVRNSSIRKQDIQLALLGRDRLIEPVKVIWVGNVPFHGGDV